MRHFSASRGNLGYMSWAFSLFCGGLILGTGLQALIGWYARVPAEIKIPRGSADFWEFVINMSVHSGVLTTIGAIILLMLSAKQLASETDDIPIVRGPLSQAPTIITLSIAGIGIAITVIVTIQFVRRNKAAGWRQLWRRTESQKEKDAKERDRRELVDALEKGYYPLSPSSPSSP